jgi:hypothetical protein
MNKLLNEYYISVQFTDVSGAEYLDLLGIRDELANFETELTEGEKEILSKADGLLIRNCQSIYQELSRFINLSEYRQKQQINPQQWWWYLDVLFYLPKPPESQNIKETSLA